MAIEFRSIVSRGAAKGEVMEAWKDSEGRYHLLDPKKRVHGSAHPENFTRTPSPAFAAELIRDKGYSMRMFLRGSSAAPSLRSAKQIQIIETTESD